jgi:hypothetical protein
MVSNYVEMSSRPLQNKEVYKYNRQRSSLVVKQFKDRFPASYPPPLVYLQLYCSKWKNFIYGKTSPIQRQKALFFFRTFFLRVPALRVRERESAKKARVLSSATESSSPWPELIYCIVRSGKSGKLCRRCILG